MGPLRILRVTVRGRFVGLDDRALEYLRSNLEGHDVARSAYTAEGTLTYDSRIDFFSLRYEIRVGPGDADQTAAARGLEEAGQFLRVMGFPHRDLRASVTDTAAAWGERRTRGLSRQDHGRPVVQETDRPTTRA